MKVSLSSELAFYCYCECHRIGMGESCDTPEPDPLIGIMFFSLYDKCDGMTSLVSCCRRKYFLSIINQECVCVS